MVRSSNQRLLGILAIAAAATMWGTVGPIVQAYPHDAAFPYATARNVFGILTLWFMVSLHRQRTRYSRADIPGLLMGGVGTACFMPFYTLGFQRTGVAIAAIVAIGSAPLFTGVVGRVVFGRVPARPWFIGTALAVVGLVLLNAPSGDTKVNLLGIGFAMCAGIAYAFQASGMEMLSRRHSPVQSVAPIWTLATILQAPIAVGHDFSWLRDPMLFAGAVYGGVLTVAITFSMFTWGITHVGSATAVTVGLMEPITAAALGILVLGETVSTLGLAGIAVVLGGLVVVSLPERTSPRQVLVEP